MQTFAKDKKIGRPGKFQPTKLLFLSSFFWYLLWAESAVMYVSGGGEIRLLFYWSYNSVQNVPKLLYEHDSWQNSSQTGWKDDYFHFSGKLSNGVVDRIRGKFIMNNAKKLPWNRGWYQVRKSNFSWILAALNSEDRYQDKIPIPFHLHKSGKMMVLIVLAAKVVVFCQPLVISGWWWWWIQIR